MIDIDDLKTRAGLLLYRQLPEEYRLLDNADKNELGDLEAYLHGFGHLLDLIRGTTEQAYADAFAEPSDLPSDQSGNTREIQTWVLPYLAELVGAELLAPDPKDRAKELDNAVSWFKTKGTLQNVDSIADVVSGAETTLVEGWRRVLTTPRMSLPPFSSPAAPVGSSSPVEQFSQPLGTPDLRFCNRAIADPDGTSPLYRLATVGRDQNGIRTDPVETFWRPRARNGVPCFAGAFDDTAARTPDLRDSNTADVGPHPRRNLIHIRPPHGFFEPNLKTVALPSGNNPLGFDTTEFEQTQFYGPEEVFNALGLAGPIPDKIVVTGNLTIPADLLINFENILFTGTISVAANNQHETLLTLSKCAVAKLHLDLAGDNPMVIAHDCLFGEIISFSGFARLVYCTVLGETHLERLQASDCLFAGELIGVTCGGEETCIRYSRLPDLKALAGCPSEKSPTNTTDDPNFVRLYFKDNGSCVLRPAAFGEPGCGVFDLTTSRAIREGAEDSAEMGAYHHLYHSAQLRAVKQKLKDFIPQGQEVAIRYDARMARPAAKTI